MVNKVWRIRVQRTRVPDPNPSSWLRLSSENEILFHCHILLWTKKKMNFWWCPDVILLSYEHKLVTKYSFWSSYEIQISKMRVFTILLIWYGQTSGFEILEFETKLPGRHQVHFSAQIFMISHWKLVDMDTLEWMQNISNQQKC